jgi:hypothetical protein
MPFALNLCYFFKYFFLLNKSTNSIYHLLYLSGARQLPGHMHHKLIKYLSSYQLVINYCFTELLIIVLLFPFQVRFTDRCS